MRVMSELMLIEETIERASKRLQSMLTLFILSFDAGEADALELHAQTGCVVDPLASAYYREARRLLLLPFPRVQEASMALFLAANKEPGCYGSTLLALLELLEQASTETMEEELAAAADATDDVGDTAGTQKRS